MRALVFESKNEQIIEDYKEGSGFMVLLNTRLF